MAKKAASPKPRRKKPSSGNWQNDPQVQAILTAMEAAVTAQLGGKTFVPSARTMMRAKVGKSVYKKLYKRKGNWGNDQGKVLNVAGHLGQIAAMLSTTQTISLRVAAAALAAIKWDEHCAGGLGRGDWCYGG